MEQIKEILELVTTSHYTGELTREDLERCKVLLSELDEERTSLIVFKSYAEKRLPLLEKSNGWIKLTDTNKPEHEVIACNMHEGSYGYKEAIVGRIYRSSYIGFNCEAAGEVLENVTHFKEFNFPIREETK